MAYTYIAYIDESGDDGLKKYRIPRSANGGGSSHWLILSACVWRFQRDLEAVGWRKEICQILEKPLAKPLHCKDLKHQEKTAAIGFLADKPFRTMCVAANKPVIPEGLYAEKNQLYFYMTRYLLERVSWFCRDMRKTATEGDGRVKIVFSRRGGMSYDDFRAYLLKLKERDDVEIKWPVIDIDGVEAVDHSRRAGLQIADLVATSVAAGLEPDRFGNCELRYANLLKQRVYERDGNYLSYGMKLVPNWDKIELNTQQLAFVDLFKGGRGRSPGP